jgi:hypothetical protein
VHGPPDDLTDHHPGQILQALQGFDDRATRHLSSGPFGTLVEPLHRSSLDPNAIESDVADVWFIEAERRDESMDRGEEAGAPAQDVLRRIERR